MSIFGLGLTANSHFDPSAHELLLLEGRTLETSENLQRNTRGEIHFK